MSPLDWQNLEVAAGAPLEWGDDSLLDDLSAIAALGAASDNLSNGDDQYLLALADDDLSSPSAYPSFFDAPPASGANYSDQWHQLSTSAQQAPAQPSAPATAAPHQHQPAAPSRTTTQLTSSSTGESQNTLLQDRSLDDEDAFPDTPLSSFSDTMPPTLRKRNPPAAAAATAQRDASASGAHMNKRRRASRAGSRPASRRGAAQEVDLVAVKDLEDEEDDLFGSSPGKRASKMEAKPEDGLTTIDLTESNEVPEDLSKPEEDNRVKLSVFQCVICMDDVTTLTVTHCGKLPVIIFSLTALLTLSRPSFLCTVPTPVPQRRSDQGQMSHVPRQSRHEAPSYLQHPQQGLLAPGAQVDDLGAEGKAQG